MNLKSYEDENEVRLPSTSNKFEKLNYPLSVHKLKSKNGHKSMKLAVGDLIFDSESQRDNSPSRKVPKIQLSSQNHNLSASKLQSKSMRSLIPNSERTHQFAKFSAIDESDEFSIEEKMKSLPHWKYKASFITYMEGLETVTPEVKEDFMKLYDKKDYTKMYHFL
jgi:hypothetical protein